MEPLNKGFVYEIQSRNLLVGVFDGDGFVGPRRKFDSIFLDKEYPRHTVRKWKQIEVCPVLDLRMYWSDPDRPGRAKQNEPLLKYLLEIEKQHQPELCWCGKPYNHHREG